MARERLNVQDMTLEEAHGRVEEIKKELFHLRFRNTMRQLDNPLQIRFLRRDLARVKTAISEHEHGIRKLGTEAKEDS